MRNAPEESLTHSLSFFIHVRRHRSFDDLGDDAVIVMGYQE